MRIMGLDISTKTGIAVIHDGQLIHKDLVEVVFSPTELKIDDFNCLDRAEQMAEQVMIWVRQFEPDFIYIEQTNLGNNRRDQKLLEFTHAMVLLSLRSYEKRIAYVDSSQWRSGLSLKFSKEDTKHNKSVKIRKEAGIRAQAGEGKKTAKHLAIRWCNEKYGLSLKVKDNDIADAICLASYGYLSRQKTTVEVDLSIIDSIF